MTLEWVNNKCKALDMDAIAEAQERQNQLTKPQGSLGDLEAIAIRIAGMQGKAIPDLENVQITVFAGDHGIADEGVSLFPQAVTTEMVKNFSRGGAAISVLAQSIGASLEVVDMGAVIDPGPLDGVIDCRVAEGTANFSQQTAMTEEQLGKALEGGKEAVERAALSGVHLFIGGEMGIANTSAAAAIASALLEKPAAELTGPGTGLGAKEIDRKAAIIQAALDKHQVSNDEPLKVLQTFGGFEIAALTGAYIRCAQLGIPVLVDGYITLSAALVASRIVPGIESWFFYSHQSAEPGYMVIMQALGATPLVNLGMRLGEGSGAAVAAPLLQLATALHKGMATFADAGVSESDG